MLTGRIVDSYTNILTVKLFARARDEDAYVRDAVDEHTGMFYASLRLNTLFGLTLSTLNAHAGDRHRRRSRSVLWTQRQGRGRHRGDGAAAGLADRQHRRLGGLAGDRHLREHRRRAGRHDDDRPADRADRHAAGAGRSTVPRGEIAFEDVRFGYGRDTGVLDGLTLDGRARREDRAGRPLRRRQVDAGQSAAALLRPRGRPHPDRRPGHRRRHAGEPARADLGGDAGHLAAAPLDPRQHPLRPARTRPTPRSSPRPSSRMPTSSSSSWRTGRAGAATTPRSASAA